MSPVAETIAFVFGLVGLGYAAGWTGLLRPQTGEALTEFAVVFAMPALLFRTMIGIDFHGAAPWALWLAYFSAIPVVWACGHVAATRLFHRDSAVGVVAGVAASFSNMLLLGIPFILAALFSGAFMRFLGRFRVHLGRVEKVMGALLVLAGILFLTGGVQAAAYWLLETFPGLARLG